MYNTKLALYKSLGQVVLKQC